MAACLVARSDRWTIGGPVAHFHACWVMPATRVFRA